MENIDRLKNADWHGCAINAIAQCEGEHPMDSFTKTWALISIADSLIAITSQLKTIINMIEASNGDTIYCAECWRLVAHGLDLTQAKHCAMCGKSVKVVSCDD